MKTTCKWILSVLSRIVIIIAVIALLPYVLNILPGIYSGLYGEVRTQSVVLSRKLESSSRLEVTKVDEEGTMETTTNVIILGTVGRTTIQYRYTASIGIDLKQVEMIADTDRIVFFMPKPEVLTDGIEALQINKQDFFSKAIDKSIETLLSEQREICRDQIMNNPENEERIWKDTVKAFNEVICEWLDPYGERHYEFEFVRTDRQSDYRNAD